jgi:hypothetical protein
MKTVLKSRVSYLPQNVTTVKFMHRHINGNYYISNGIKGGITRRVALPRTSLEASYPTTSALALNDRQGSNSSIQALLKFNAVATSSTGPGSQKSVSLKDHRQGNKSSVRITSTFVQDYSCGVPATSGVFERIAKLRGQKGW